MLSNNATAFKLIYFNLHFTKVLYFKCVYYVCLMFVTFIMIIFTTVQPPLYNNRIQLISLEGENGCELRTHGSGSFSAENGEIIVEVKAHDGSGLSHKTSIASVSILIGFRAPQFYQSIYNGFMLENNEVNQRSVA